MISRILLSTAERLMAIIYLAPGLLLGSSELPF